LSGQAKQLLYHLSLSWRSGLSYCSQKQAIWQG